MCDVMWLVHLVCVLKKWCCSGRKQGRGTEVLTFSCCLWLRREKKQSVACGAVTVTVMEEMFLFCESIKLVTVLTLISLMFVFLWVNTGSLLSALWGWGEGCLVSDRWRTFPTNVLRAGGCHYLITTRASSSGKRYLQGSSVSIWRVLWHLTGKTSLQCVCVKPSVWTTATCSWRRLDSWSMSRGWMCEGGVMDRWV